MHDCLRPLALSLVALAAAAPAQLTLTSPSGTQPGTGGSVAGSLQLVLTGPVGVPGAILLATNAGPTPLLLVDPSDPRSLAIGTGSLTVFPPSIFLPPNNEFTIGPFNITSAGFIGVPLFFQGIDFGGGGCAGCLVGNISNPSVVRFAAANSMRSTGTMALRRSFAEVMQNDDGTLIAAGGGQGSVLAQIPTKTTEVYDTIADTWSAGANDLTVGRTLYRVQRMQDGRYLCVGGLGSGQGAQDTAEVYDPATQTFSAVASMSTRRAAYRGVVRPNGTVIILGGFTHLNAAGGFGGILTSSTATSEIYDPGTDTWTAGPAMNVPRATFEMVDIGNDKYLIAGGVGPFTHPMFGVIPLVYPACDIYDAVANTITPTNSMSGGAPGATGRAAFAMIRVGGKVVAAGGGDVIDGTYMAGRVTTSSEVYDIATQTWTASGSMATSRGFHFAFDLGNGKSLHVGGANGNLISLIPQATTEIYDIATGTFSAGPNLPVPTTGYGPFETRNGEIFLVGGSTTGTTALNSVNVYYR